MYQYQMDAYMLIYFLFTSFGVAITGYVFTNILENEGMIFGWYNKLIMRLPMWLYKPLGGCSLCFTGQLAFWGFLIFKIHSYDLLQHVFFTMLSIYIVHILENKSITWKD